MLALMLERAGLDPTAVIGGRLSAFGSNARLGQGEYMVAEADESDRSFLKLSPAIAVITNIDHEHLDAYGSFERLVEAFADFAGRVPFYGAVVACVDDPPVAALLPRLDRRTITYGFSEPADVRGLAPVVRRPVRRDAACTTRSAACLAARAKARSRSWRAGPSTTSRTRSRSSRSVWTWACRSAGSRPRSPNSRGAERRYQVRGTRAWRDGHR